MQKFLRVRPPEFSERNQPCITHSTLGSLEILDNYSVIIKEGHLENSIRNVSIKDVQQ